VDSRGQERAGTRKGPGTGQPNCDEPGEFNVKHVTDNNSNIHVVSVISSVKGTCLFRITNNNQWEKLVTIKSL
jgi:hypothetical protein